MRERLAVVWYFIRARYLRHFRTRKALRSYQKQRVLRQLAYFKEHSPYFKGLSVHSFEDFRKLPLMNKEFMMEHFNVLNCVGIDRDEALSLAIDGEKQREFSKKLGGISVGLSSGTSGARGLFLVSDRERALWAGTVLAKFLPKCRLFGHRIAFFLRADNNLYETIDSKLIRFRYFDLLRDMEENLSELSDYSPTLLVAPPSVLLGIARAMERGELRINPEKVISVAEVLRAEDAAYLKAQFGLSVIHQAYQCTEGFLGYVCECGNFHLNEELVLIEREYLDAHRFVPIVTDFTRQSQPIVRYRLNDILVEKRGHCPCGNPATLIRYIEGREDDVFYFAGIRQKEVAVFPDFISRCVIYAEEVQNYKVVQDGSAHVTVFLERESSATSAQIRREFARLAEKMKFHCPEIEFAPYVPDYHRKMKRVERKIGG
ncbi:F390 synthetase-related protein [Stomatobaculum longum]